MGRNDPRFLVVGHLNKPHGTKGELFVWPLTDHPEGIYAPGVVLRLGDSESDEPNFDLPPLEVEEVRPSKGGLIVRFAGVESRDEADLLRGRYLLVPFEDVAPLQDGEVFYHQLLGMAVLATDGTELGEVTEVFELQPSDLLEVRSGEETYMIPFSEHLVVEVDVEGQRLVIDPPDGLLDL